MTLLEQVTLFVGSSVLGGLGGVYSAMRERRARAYLPKGAVATAALGGFLCAVGTTSMVLHFYGWERPWLILGGAVIAGVGAPVLLAAAVRKIRRKIESDELPED